ncbi:uncharacterized protein B0T23DRAFT_96106 [Neurospora hispaniola]|uniref:Uncharacterized protein n=1 Tax=Neurospora hispaniola TaxID=588809 RepID=A0AAJ0MUC0_9PEZI|nr:hypothetical protein B0T23DRAFT_96106 [Neurospora hispaniola]
MASTDDSKWPPWQLTAPHVVLPREPDALSSFRWTMDEPVRLDCQRCSWPSGAGNMAPMKPHEAQHQRGMVAGCRPLQILYPAFLAIFFSCVGGFPADGSAFSQSLNHLVVRLKVEIDDVTGGGHGLRGTALTWQHRPLRGVVLARHQPQLTYYLLDWSGRVVSSSSRFD